MKVGPWYDGNSVLIEGDTWELSLYTKWEHSEQAEGGGPTKNWISSILILHSNL